MKLSQKLRVKGFEAWFWTMSAVEQLTKGVSLNVFSSKLHEDPYPYLNAVRNKEPIYYSYALRGWWVTRFDWVQEVLTDKRFGSDVRQFEDRAERIRKQLDGDRLEDFENPSMLSLDPPDHSRIRRLAAQGFMRNFINSLAPRIQKIVDNCLDRHDNDPTFDVVESLAKPLPAIVIAEMMGLPESDHDDFQSWSEDLIDGTGTNDIEEIERANQANRSLIAYFRRIIAERRGNPGDDLIGQLIRAEEEGDKLTERELYNTCLLLLVAGHETTTRLISNGLYTLLKNPEHWQYLKDNPERIENAVEEMLRFEPPVQATQRFAREDMEFHGHKLKRGDIIFVSIAAANRDPDANDDPDAFNLDREKVKQVSFGYGIHLCIGAALARLEAKIAFESLLQRYPNLELADLTPHWGSNPFFRGLDVLEVNKGQSESSATAMPDSPATA